MSLISKSISTLTGGVSRQPFENRNDAQVEECLNSLLDPSEGAVKRPPSKLLGTYGDLKSEDVLFAYTYDRDKSERYNVFVCLGVTVEGVTAPNRIRVFDATSGVEYPVDQDLINTGYLDQGSGNFEALTLGDNTFLTNKDVKVEMSGVLEEEDELRALLAMNSLPRAADDISPPRLLWVKGLQANGDLAYSIPFDARYEQFYEEEAKEENDVRSLVISWLDIFCAAWNKTQTDSAQNLGPALDQAHSGQVYWSNVPLQDDQNGNAVKRKGQQSESKVKYKAENPDAETSGTDGGAGGYDYYVDYPQPDGSVVTLGNYITQIQQYNEEEHGSDYGVRMPWDSIDYPENYNDIDPAIYPFYGYKTAWTWLTKNADEPFREAIYQYSEGELLNLRDYILNPIPGKTADGSDLTAVAEYRGVNGLPPKLNGEPNPYRDEILKFEGLGLTGVLFTTASGPADIGDLPADAPDGFKTKMIGDSDVVADEYYLKFDRAKSTWFESRAGGTDHTFNTTTMPHLLTRVVDPDESYGVRFVFGPADGLATEDDLKWAERSVGDKDNAPEPSFVGEAITGLSFYKGRLAFITDRSVVLSETNQVFNFWPTTVMTLKDSDPMDLEVALGEGSVVNMFAATSTEAGLILYDRQSQHLLRAEDGQAFGPRTVTLDTISRYPIGTGVNPQFIGSKIYWTTESGSNTSKVWEYTLEGGRADAQEITIHVPSYLPPGINEIVGSKNSDMMFLRSLDSPDTLWAYHSTFVDNKRMQAAWSEWNVGGTVLHSYMLDDTLYIVVSRDGTLSLESIDPAHTDDPCGFSVSLDSRVTGGPIPEDLNLYGDMPFIASYDEETNLTTFERGPRWQQDSFNSNLAGRTLVAGENTPWPGRIIETTAYYGGNPANGASLRTQGNLIPNGDEVYYLGYDYEQTIELSRFILSSDQSAYSNARVLNDGRTQLKTLAVHFSEAGAFDITHNVGGDEFKSTHTPTRIDSSFNPPAQEKDGSFRTDIGGNTMETTTTFSNDSPIPTKITGLLYEVQYHSRGNRSGRGRGRA